METWFLVSAEGNALGIVVWNVSPFTRGGQCIRWNGMETWFFVPAEGNPLGVVAWKCDSLYPRRAMLSVEGSGKVFPCIRGG